MISIFIILHIIIISHDNIIALGAILLFLFDFLDLDSHLHAVCPNVPLYFNNFIHIVHIRCQEIFGVERAHAGYDFRLVFGIDVVDLDDALDWAVFVKSFRVEHIGDNLNWLADALAFGLFIA